MFPYVLGAVVGALMMGRTKPKTSMRTMKLLGPRTGLTYTAETMPGNDVIALHAEDFTIALFRKGPDGRFRLLHPLQGSPDTVKLMQKDLEP